MGKTRDFTLGSALLTALFIMTLAAIAATAMTTRLRLDIYRAQLISTTNKLNYASQFVTFWAMNELNNPTQKFLTSDKEGKVADFPRKLAQSYPPFTISGAIYDLQNRFNINNLSSPHYFVTMVRLLDSLPIKLTKKQKEDIIINIYQWISPAYPDHRTDPLITFYLNQKPPYLPGNQPMQSPSELRLLKGISTAVYQTLLPHIVALPTVTALNIYTAPPEQLRFLGNGLKDTEIKRLLQLRQNANPSKIATTLSILKVPLQQMTMSSEYFLCIATASYQRLNLIHFSLLRRYIDKQQHLHVELVQESMNTF